MTTLSLTKALYLATPPMTFEGISNERIVTWVTDNTGIAENAILPAIEYVWTTTG
ncbi:hypothetical protein MRX96_047568, partial [Rhipicephalus microplus]